MTYLIGVADYAEAMLAARKTWRTPRDLPGDKYPPIEDQSASKLRSSQGIVTYQRLQIPCCT